MLHELLNRLHRRQFASTVRSVENTPPLKIKDAPLRFLSQVSHRDVFPYLAAIKSVYKQIGEGQVVVVGDGSLTPEDEAILQYHLGTKDIRCIQDVDTKGCPKGGTWERLLSILDLSRDYYVIQVDADIMAVGPMEEVIAAYRENRAFTLGTRMGREPVNLSRATEMVAGSDFMHVQVKAEQCFGKLANASARKYVRGCSGFAGFAKGGFKTEDLRAFSQEVSAMVGVQKWAEWGSEQVSSNYVVANSPNPLILPYPKYANYDLEVDLSGTSLIHFVGTNRFDRGEYRRRVRDFIKAS